MRKNIAIGIALLFVFCSTIFGQSRDAKYAEDVKSVDAIINAYYSVISGSSSDPWQFERDKYIHADNAIIIRITDDEEVVKQSLEAEYIPLLLTRKENLYEMELKRKVNQFGNIAQVWSAYEVRADPNKPTNLKGLNSIQLHFGEGRWWIDSWTTQMESDENHLVSEFLNNK